MNGSFQLFHIRGIPLRVHITFPLILIWSMIQFGLISGLGAAGAIFGVIVTLLLFGIVVLHELGHAIAAQQYGVDVREIVLLPIGGVAQLGHIPDKPAQELVIALAGPAVNFVIALIMWVVNSITGIGGTLRDPVMLVFGFGQLDINTLFSYLFTANLFLAVFNLIPAFPMDGGRVLRALLALRLEYARATAVAVTIGQTLAWVIGLWGFLGGGFFLILIAFFIYMGAGYEGRVTAVRSVLDGITVAQAYSRRVQVLPPTATLRQAIDLTLRSFQADFPICDGDRLIGLLTYRKLIEALGTRSADTIVTDVMETDAVPASPHDSLFDVQQRMGQGQIDALPVVQDGHFLGLLTLRDIGEVYRIASTNPDLLPRPSKAEIVGG